MKRLGPSVESALLTLGVIVGVGVALSAVTLVPGASQQVAAGNQPGVTQSVDPAATDSQPGATGPSAGPGTSTVVTVGGKAGGAGSVGLRCAPGANGGSTDVGVTGNSVKLAATVVDDGPGSSFLAPVRIGMNAALDKANHAGGICGRQLNLLLQNDSWDATRGEQYIQNFVEGEKVFALAVVPSSEGLRAADSYIRQQGVPVVGTDGMLIHQYRNPWIWPVAASTISTMHIMAKNAYDRGARRFSIVFDAKYHFGVEGAYAFDQAVRRLTGSDIPGYDPSLKSCQERFCGIQPGQPAYGSETQSFNNSCYQTSLQGGTCDFTAYLLEPDTAVTWMSAGRPANPSVGSGGAQPLFTYDFETQCKAACDGMWVWTGYNPPVEAFASQPGVATYVNDVRRESSSADVNNQFLEGGYDGMRLLLQALQQTGPNLTRAGLKTTLDSMTFDDGLSNPLKWTPGSHFANQTSQAFIISYGTSPNGWRYAQTGFITDPWVGQDIPPGE